MKLISCLLCSILLITNANQSIAETKQIIKEKNIYFLSPHFDDIPLTFGGLILNGTFKEKNNNVIVFFGLSSYSANGPDKDKSDERVNYITNTRAKEDRSALTELFHGWRNFKYSIYGEKENTVRNFKGPKNAGGGPSGNFSSFRPIEIETFNNIYEELLPILQKKDCAAFVLSGIQSHIDHFMVREALIKAVHDLGNRAQCQIYFGEDQPYAGANKAITNNDLKYMKERLHLETITYPIDVNKKVDTFARNYYSQYEDSYIDAIRSRAIELNKSERIYIWPKENYKFANTDLSCKEHFCLIESVI